MTEERREKPTFEPPPWERDAFDELARKRAEEEAAQRRAAEAAAAARAAEAVGGPADSVPAPGTTADPAQPGEDAVPWLAEKSVAGEPMPVMAAAGVAATVSAAPPAARTRTAPKSEMDDPRVEAMLAELRGEQGSVERAVRPVAATTAIVMALTGIGIAAAGIWGATKAGGSTAGMGGAVMTTALGCAFVGAGIWVWIRASRGKGSR